MPAEATRMEARPEATSGVVPDGRHCPACGAAVGLGRMLRVTLYDAAIWCPGCAAELRYSRISLRARLGLTAVGLVVIVGLLLAVVWLDLPGPVLRVWGAIVGLAGLVGLRFLMAMY